MKKSIFPKLTARAFDKQLEGRSYEDVLSIRAVESYFLKKRGYVIRMPKPKTPVILLVSGGMDSTILWYVLLKEFKLDVYPLYIRSSWFHPQERSVWYFARLFQNRLGKRVRQPYVLNHDIFPKQFRDVSKSTNISADTLLSIYLHTGAADSLPQLAGLAALTPVAAFLYAKYLSLTTGVDIQHVLTAVTAGDGTRIPSQSFSFLRTTMFFLTQFQKDKDFQFFSPLIDRSLGRFIEKHELFALGKKMKLPLEKTYSCYRGGLVHCGTCMSCIGRRHGLERALYEDTTLYVSHLSSGWRRRVRKLLYRILDKPERKG